MGYLPFRDHPELNGIPKDTNDMCDEDYEDWTWGDPDAPGQVRHAMAALDGKLSCCGRTVEQIGRDWQTSDPSRVNCPGGSLE